MNGIPILSLLMLLPLIGTTVIIGIGSEHKRLARSMALVFSFISLALAIVLWAKFVPSNGELQFEESHSWIPSLGVQYHLGLDGLSIVLVLLSAIVVPMSILASWRIQQRVP